PSRQHPGELPGDGAGVPGRAGQRALADPGRAGSGLHRSGRALRELHPPAHDPVHLAVGRGGGDPRAAGLPGGAECHRADRHNFADRHREEERDHDDRLRSGGGARAGPELPGRHLPGLPPAIPPDHDDHDGRVAGGAPARARTGSGLRAPPASRHRHRGGAHREPAAHALHHAGDLSRLRRAGAPLPAGSGGTGMNISAPFLRRPVATTLLTIGLALSGILAWGLLPVSPLPQVDFPTIQVTATLPGAEPDTMATSVAAPLERQFGRIAGLTELTSASYLGSTSVALQFDLSRNIDRAARDVQAAINAARGYLPPALPNNPSYRKVNPADAPIMIVALTSDTLSRGRMYDAASSILQQKLSQLPGVGQVIVGGSSLPAVRVEMNPTALNQYGIALETVRGALAATTQYRPKGQLGD